MTKKPFEVGQRVKCYGTNVVDDGAVGTLRNISSYFPIVEVAIGTSYYKFHIKQLRRLKAKRVPREYWIEVARSGECVDSAIRKHYLSPDNGNEIVHVVEKFEKAKP